MLIKRILMVGISCLVGLFATFYVLSSPVSAAPAKAPVAGDLTVTVLNKDPNQSNHIIAFYDHNENQIDYVAGHYAGASVCATGSQMDNVVATISGLPAYDGNNNENEFELGRNESTTRDLGSLAIGQCKIVYYYLATPRYKNGGTELPQTTAIGMTTTFTITAVGFDDTVTQRSQNDSGIVEMDQAISAAPNQITQVITSNGSFIGAIMTMTVDFDLGNPGGNNDATFNPTGWITHDAGIFDLINISISMPGQPGVWPQSDELFKTGLTAANTAGSAIYTFVKVGPGRTEYFPVQVISSGGQDKYNADAGGVGTGPLAISLQGVAAGGQTDLGVATLLTVGALLCLAGIFWQRRRFI